jgi:cytochrome c553
MAADRRSKEAGRFARLAMTVCVALMAGATASRGADAPPLEERLAACAGCHGEKGISSMPEAPSLAGQPVLYTQIQLFLFREGQRVNEIMSPMAQGLTDDELTALAEWYARQPPPVATKTPDPEFEARGRALAATHRCGVCHLPDYGGRDQIPRIAALSEPYLLKALRDYKTSARSGDGAQMAEVVVPLGDDELQALAHHLAHFK